MLTLFAHIQDIIHIIFRYVHILKNFITGKEGDLSVGFPDRFNSSLFVLFIVNKHSESIAKAIQVPYRPQQIFKRHNSYKSRSKGAKVICDLFYIDTN